MTWLGSNVIETYSGESYDFLSPDPDAIKLLDIAHALSNACRFAGHTSCFYSVAEHSVIVSQLVEAWYPKESLLIDAALFHDAHEAYVWDAPRPIKPLLGEQFVVLADTADEAIGRALYIDHRLFHHPVVKRADDLLLLHEGRKLMKRGPGNGVEPEPLPEDVIRPYGMEPTTAKALFIERAYERGYK